MKDRDSILNSRWLRPFAHLFAHPSLWHLNRRSVPRALAAGLFVGFMIPLGQFIVAALLAVPLRANVPLAAGATLVTNPITFPAIYFAAFKTGQSLLGRAPQDATTTSIITSMLDVSVPIALGLLIFAVIASLAGYFAGSLWWRLRIVRRRRKKS